MLIDKYTPTWIEDFEKLKLEIGNVLYELNFKIEHIGSTSVPNLDSKPIIDIDIIYFEESDFGKIKLRLERIGYYHNPLCD